MKTACICCQTAAISPRFHSYLTENRRKQASQPSEKQVKSSNRSLKAAYPSWGTVDLYVELPKWCVKMRELCLDLPKLCGKVGKFVFEIWGLST